VVEEQIDGEVFVADAEAVLPAHECKALTEFEQELLQVLNESGFEFAFLERLRESEEVEYVGVFQRLLDEVRLRSGQDRRRLGRSLTFSIRMT
jgi:hypothetical protein